MRLGVVPAGKLAFGMFSVDCAIEPFLADD
jgi:hypothetical protein